jgi:hypothetical protein
MGTDLKEQRHRDNREFPGDHNAGSFEDRAPHVRNNGSPGRKAWAGVKTQPSPFGGGTFSEISTLGDANCERVKLHKSTFWSFSALRADKSIMKQRGRRIWISSLFVVFALSANLHAAATDDYSKRSVSQLIDDLTQIDAQAPGLDSAAVYSGFLANEAGISFEMGVLGVPPPHVPPQMRELVRRGPVALPELIKHLDDRRPTKLEVGNKDPSTSTHGVGIDTFMWTVFSDEYDPRSLGPRNEKHEPWKVRMMTNFQGRYIVRVGDVCYVLIGQIVNRRLFAVRYQASAGLIVNSPIEAPVLAEQVRNDWGNADPEVLRASLLADLRATNPSSASYTQRFNNSALERLRLYFPDTYNALEGDDLKTKNGFEEDETRRKYTQKN